MESNNLNVLKGVTHHGDEHVDKDDDDGHVIEGKQEHADPLDDRRGVVASREAVGIVAALLLAGILDLHTVDVHQPKHAPEQTVQSSRKSGVSRWVKRII